VALKIIKLGMDTKEVIARFEQERQALSLMDHPNIAKILDAGVTQHGRPFFVMELVRGLKITEYCDEKQLSTGERIELFITVCQAVQHAHQKGIIHRDLKPSNILVTINDGKAVPKVIDFGVAKATQGRLTDQTVYTQFQQMIGTPLYMSPEQAELTSLDMSCLSRPNDKAPIFADRSPMHCRQMAQKLLFRRIRLAVLHPATALALAGVLAGAAVVAALATAFALTAVFAGAIVRFALLFVGDFARAAGDLAVAGRAGSLDFGDEAAGENARKRRAGENGFRGVDAFHVCCCGLLFLVSVRASGRLLAYRRGQRVSWSPVPAPRDRRRPSISV
jgi:hypothetical protein